MRMFVGVLLHLEAQHCQECSKSACMTPILHNIRRGYSEQYVGNQGHPLSYAAGRMVDYLQGHPMIRSDGDCAALTAVSTYPPSKGLQPPQIGLRELVPLTCELYRLPAEL